MKKNRLTLLFINGEYRVKRFQLPRWAAGAAVLFALLALGLASFLGWSAGRGDALGDAQVQSRQETETLSRELDQARMEMEGLRAELETASAQRDEFERSLSAALDENMDLEERLASLQEALASSQSDTGSVSDPGQGQEEEAYTTSDLPELFPPVDSGLVSVDNVSISRRGPGAFRLSLEVGNPGKVSLLKGETLLSLVLSNAETVDMQLDRDEALFQIRRFKRIVSAVDPGDAASRGIGWLLSVVDDSGEVMFLKTFPMDTMEP